MPGTNGADVVLAFFDGASYNVLGSQRGLTVGKTTDILDSSSKENVDATHLYGRRHSTMSLDALFIETEQAYLDLKAAYDNQTQILVRRRRLGNDVEQASCLVAELSESEPDNDVATFRTELTITGGWAAV